MITIQDPKKLLNLKQTEIYILVSNGENVAYQTKLKSLTFNKLAGRRFFHINTVIKGEETNATFGDIFKGATSSCNIIVRLVNHIHGIYYYALDYLDLKQSISELQDAVSHFIDEVCQANIDMLQIHSQRNACSAISAMRKNMEDGLIEEVFHKILAKGDPTSVRTEQGVQADVLLQKAGKTSSSEESLAIMQRAADSSITTRRPKIVVSIKRIPTIKNQRTVHEYGFEFLIDGQRIPVYFGNADLTMLYALVLIKQQRGELVHKKLFKTRAQGEMRRKSLTLDELRQRDALEDLLHRLYDCFNFSRSFRIWYEVATSDGSHRISDAKAKINKALKSIFGEKFKDACPYCTIEATGNRNNTTYQVGIEPDHIEIAGLTDFLYV